ncbi:MAG: hypothetical protein IKO49_00365 [Bacilli bacterium]|nr:hypothetical protein [Bacilli bacterium]
MSNRKKIFLFFIIIIVSLTFGFLLSIEFKHKYKKKLEKYAINETKHFIVNLVKEIVNNSYEDKYDEKIFAITRNNYDEIEIIDFNTKEVNKILEKITINIEKNLNFLEKSQIENILYLDNEFKGRNYKFLKKGVLFDLGDDFFNEKFIFSSDTKIPVKLSFIGNVYTSISTNIKNYGYNSAYLEVNILVEIKEKVKLPTSSFEYTIKQRYPIAVKIIQGNVPNYYNNQFSSSSNSYSLPIKK